MNVESQAAPFVMPPFMRRHLAAARKSNRENERRAARLEKLGAPVAEPVPEPPAPRFAPRRTLVAMSVDEALREQRAAYLAEMPFDVALQAQVGRELPDFLTYDMARAMIYTWIRSNGEA